MRFFRRIPFVLPILFFTLGVKGQDKIILTSDIRKGKILEISSESVKYQTLEKPSQTVLLSVKDAVIIFNSKGDYLIPSKLDPQNTTSRELISKFLAADNNPETPKSDLVITNKKGGINCHIINEDSRYIFLSDSLKLDKTIVVAIIYKNGQPKIFGNVDSAAVIMWSVQKTNFPSLSSKSVVVQPTPDPKSTAYTPTAIAVKTSSNAGPPSASPTSLDTKKPSEPISADSAREKAFRELAGDISSKEFEMKAIQKTNKLNEYLKILCNKNASTDLVNEATDQAVNLFVNENAIVETSSIKENTVHHYKIREYLTRVKFFKYDKIDIEWTNVQYVSNLKLGPDGNYYGVVSFEQSFRAYRDGQLIYSDITRKNANVVLKTYKKSVEGTTKTIWDVLLSDIGVRFTKASDVN